MMNAIAHYIGARYDGTRLYIIVFVGDNIYYSTSCINHLSLYDVNFNWS